MLNKYLTYFSTKKGNAQNINKVIQTIFRYL